MLGIDAARRPEALKERIGVQLQTAALYPNLTVHELIELFGCLYRRRRPSAELIGEFGLEERRDALSGQLVVAQREKLILKRRGRRCRAPRVAGRLLRNLGPILPLAIARMRV